MTAMYLAEDSWTGTPVAPETRLAAARAFLAEHGAALVSAAALLGGPLWERRAIALLEGLPGAERFTRSIEQDLTALHGLLALEHFDNLDSVEAGCFAALDPADARVHEICRLTDRLADLLDEIAGLPASHGHAAAAAA